MNSHFDKEINSLDDLRWLPWVGENYSQLNSSEKILIIGESHYYKNINDLINQGNRQFTRGVVQDSHINGHYNDSPFYPKLNKLLFNKPDLSQDQRIKFYSNVCFLNFVQRSMNYTGDNSEKPSKKDFEIGWKSFYETLAILKPSVCIFLGIQVGNYYGKGTPYQAGFKLSVPEYKEDEKKFIHIELVDLEQQKINLYFVNHPSARGFDAISGNSYLSTKDPEIMNWIKNIIE